MQFAQNVKYEPRHLEDQQAFVDARAPLNRDEDELVDDSPEDRPVQDTNDPETPHSLMEPEFERGNTPPRPRRLESYGQIREPRLPITPQLPITGTEVALLNPELSLSNDRKIVRWTRQTR